VKYSTQPYDTADYLTSDALVAAYLTVALESYDSARIAQALGTVARAKGGITRLARITGLSREALHRALSDGGNPEFATVLKVVKGLGIMLTASIPDLRKTNLRVPPKRKPVQRSPSTRNKAA
jgi:probable addiction module antidote protein